MPPLDVPEIAKVNLWEPFSKVAPSNQAAHRINLTNLWDIPEGGQILELGCGQGDCTAVLAAVVGDSGHVTGVDPAPLDYGAPWTLGEAQAHLMQSNLGHRMTFVQAKPVEFLALPENHNKFDSAVLAHCIYYMASPTTLLNTFRALFNTPGIKRVCVAEYALSTSLPEAYPHVAAVLMQAAVEVHKDGEKSESNVRTVLGPEQITRLAKEAGWAVQKEGVICPDSGLEDGHWEVAQALSYTDDQLDSLVPSERERAMVGAMKGSVVRLVGTRGVKQVRTMDVWWAVLTKPE